LLRQARDKLLMNLVYVGLAPEEAAKSAQAQPLRCAAVKR
jgi:hypothetical protein